MQWSSLLILTLLAIVTAANVGNPLSTRNILAIYAVFICGRLLSVVAAPDTWLQMESPLRVAALFLAACISVRAGYELFERWSATQVAARPYKLPDGALLVVGLACQLLGLLGWLRAVSTTGFSVLNVAALLTNDTRYLGETPLIVDLAMHLSGAGVALLSLRIDSGKRLVQTLLLSAPSLLLAVVLSRRSLIVPLLVFPLFVYWSRVSRVKVKKALLAGVALLSLSTCLLAMRFYYGFGWEREDGGLQASVASGFLMHFEEADPLLAVLDRHNAMASEPWARISWVAWIYELVPAGIAGEKPRRTVVPVAVAQRFFGSTDSRNGLPATVIGTLFLSGGFPMLIIGGLVVGAVMRGTDGILERWRWDDWGLPIGIWAWMFVALFLFRLGDLSAAIGQVLVQALALLFVVTLLRLVYVQSCVRPWVAKEHEAN